MSELHQKLARIITRQGPIRLSDFMAASIDQYYADRDPFGTRGDFITAPEITSVFGELIGLWLVETWRRMGRPSPTALIELGPGRGSLMRDALNAARVDPAFLAAIEIHLVERSQRLRTGQKEMLAQVACPIRHHDRLDTIPDGPCLIIANEFFDCLAVRQFEKTDRGWKERYVTYDPERDHFALCLPEGQHAQNHWIPAHLNDSAIGEIFETSPQAHALSLELALRVQAGTGAALIIDYGTATSRSGATIQAIRSHTYHQVLDDPGTADITALVDFEALANAARGKAKVFGPVSQARFLGALGIHERAGQMPDPSLTKAVRRLVDRDQMGELFQVMALANLPHDQLAPGFEKNDA